jgi:diguanylate cyclase (GGDEF)-like protein
LSGYAPIKHGGGRYLVGIDMRADQVYEKYKGLRVSGLISLLASIALAFLFARFLSAKFIAPIHLAIDRCTAIAAGKLDEQITLRTHDELDHLLKAFNDMSAALAHTEHKRREAFDALQRAKDELEIRVRQRTADLSEVNNRLSNEIAQRIIAQTALQEAATVDPLTRLYNRRAMMEHFDHEIGRNKRNQLPFSVLFIDLDHFKRINDAKGHEAGDCVLIEISIRMKNMLRSQDSIARWGGEEFVVLLPETTLAEGRIVAEKIRRAIADTPFYAHGVELFLTASFGVAEFRPGLDISQTINAADAAVYAAKMNGRNRVEIEGAVARGTHQA